MLSKFVYFTAVLLMVSGCQTTKQIVGPDGTPHQLVGCLYIEHCYEKAREVCGGNYKIINTSSSTSGSEGNTSSDISLLVKCEKQK